MKDKILKTLIIVTLIIVVLDQSIKFLIEKNVKTDIGFKEVGIEVSHNTGMAFGFNEGNTKNIFLTFFVLYLISSFLIRQRNELDMKTTIAISIAFGGGLSNLIDRIFRGGVLDYIKIWKLPMFNIADICICVAWVMIVIFLIMYTNKSDVIKDVDIEELKIKEKDEDQNGRQN